MLCKLLKCTNESYSRSSLFPTKWVLQCHTPFCRTFGSFMSPLQGITFLLSPSTTTCLCSCILRTSILLHGFVIQDAGSSFSMGRERCMNSSHAKSRRFFGLKPCQAPLFFFSSVIYVIPSSY
jgi:hypothetical protein